MKLRKDGYFHTGNLLTIFVFSFLVCLSVIPLHWGYDEFGAVVTNLELDDPAYSAIYSEYVRKMGIKSEIGVWLFEQLLIPFFITPIRWTYALGISPVISIVRFLSIDWQLMRLLLLIPYIVAAGLGFSLISRYLYLRNQSFVPSILFAIIIFTSQDFLYWTLTLTSYSHHLLCVGLILFSFSDKGRSIGLEKKFLHIIALTLVPIFNYQYIPILGCLFIYDSYRRLKWSNKKEIFLIWCLPLLSCVASTAFLYARGIVSGKHSDPAMVVLKMLPEGATYLVSDMGSGIYLKSLGFVERIVDIGVWLFSANSSNATTLTNLQFIVFVIVLIVFVRMLWKSIDSETFSIFGIMMLSTFMLYAASVLPMTPSRHQLVLVLPLAGLVSIFIFRTLSQVLSEPLQTKLCWTILLCIVTLQFLDWREKEAHFPSDQLKAELQKFGVQQLVLNPCNYQPLFVPELRQKYSPIYKCGNLVAKTLSDSVSTVGIWADNRVNETTAVAILSNYSQAVWKIESAQFFSNGSNQFFGSLYIANKIKKGAVTNE